MPVNYKPAKTQAVIPYLVVDHAAGLIDFLQKTFEATEIERMARPDGKIMHSQLMIDDSVVMLSDSTDSHPARKMSIYVYVKDTDATYKRALAAGATSVMEPADQFYGDRNGGVTDAFGNQWWIGTHLEDVSVEEIERRKKEQFAAGQRK